MPAVPLAIAIVSAVSSCGIAVLCTVAIEKLGGVSGGILATTPTTIVPFSFGLAMADPTMDEVRDAMLAVPIAICLTSLSLAVWREAPRMRCVKAMPSPYLQVAAVLLCTISLWVLAAFGIVSLLDALSIPILLPGLIFFVLSGVIGVVVLFTRYVPSPTGKKPITILMLLSRGVLAGLSIGVSLLLSSLSAVAGGLASAFPAVTTTTMVALWLQQGEEVPAGAAAPMMLGNLAVSLYCLFFAALYPAMADPTVSTALTATAASLLCWLFATLAASLPVFALVQWRTNRGKEEEKKDKKAELLIGHSDQQSTDSAA